MANISYPTRIISAHGTAQEWSTANPILNLGEIGVATDVHRLKIGDGVTRWNALDWIVADTSRTIEFADDFVIDVKNGGTGVQDFGTPGFLKANGQNNFTTVANIVENDILFSDNSTGDASTSTHGFLRKLNNDKTYFLSGKGTWLIPQYMIPTGLGLSTSVSSSVVSLKVNYKSNLSETSISTSGYTLPLATGTLAGILSAEAQTIGGVKTFSSGIIGNLTGNADTSTTIKTVIQSSVTDLNTFLDAGEYYISQTDTTTASHIPSNLSSYDGLILRVFNPIYSNGSDWGYKIIQFAIGSNSGNVYVRTITRLNTSSEFTFNSWNQLNFTTNVDNILSGNTTFYGTKTFNSSIIGNLTGNADTASMLNFTSVNTNTTSKNLNDYITPGLYVFQNITTNNLSNSPVPDTYSSSNNVNGFLEVFCVNKSPSNSSYIVGFQRFTIHRYSSSDNKMAKTYIRGFSKTSSTNISGMTTANNFTPWKTFLNENDISSLETTVSNILDGTSTVEYANKLKLTLLSSNSISVNLNEVIEPGLYYGYYTTNPSGSGISHTNFPSDFPSDRMYYMYVNNYNYGNGTSYPYIIQRLYSVYSGNVIFYIRNVSYDGSTNPATTSGTWLKVATNNDISNILTGNITLSGTKTFSSNIIGNLTGNVTGNVSGTASNLTYTSIPNDGTKGPNDYKDSGLYYCSGALDLPEKGTPPRPVNYPGGIRYYLLVFNKDASSASTYVGYQIFVWCYGNTSSIYYRQFAKSTFYNWIKITDSLDFNPVKNNVDNILDGSTTFAGTKTFSSNIVGNLTGTASNATKDENGRNIASGYLYRGSYERIQGTSSSHKDLDNYTDPGFYNVKTAYVDHCPSGIGIDAVLLVYPWSSTNTVGSSNGLYILQELTEGASSTDNRRWVRCSNNGTFSTWKQIAFTTSDITGNLTGNVTGNVSGNAGTADRLKYRYIAGNSTSCDMNTKIEPGLYYGYYTPSPTGTGVTHTNFPSGITSNYFYMRVYNVNNTETGLQTLTFCGTGDMYIRSFVYNPSTNPATFSSDNGWQKYAKSSELNTLSGTVDGLSTSLSTLSTGLTNRGIYSDAKNVGAASGKTFDFNDMTSHGMYYVNTIDGTISNKPTSSNTRGWLFVHHGSGSSYYFQMFITATSSPTKSTVYYRYKMSSWTSWFRLVSDNESTFVGNIAFASSGVTDLDTYKTQGVYGFVSGNATNANSANFPDTYGGILLVFGNGGTNVLQIYITYGMSGIFYRQGNFSSTPTGITWKCILDGNTNKIVEINQNGGSSLKLPNYTSYTYEYCVYEFDSTSKAFSNMYVGSAAGNTSITTPSSSKIYRGWYRRIR